MNIRPATKFSLLSPKIWLNSLHRKRKIIVLRIKTHNFASISAGFMLSVVIFCNTARKILKRVELPLISCKTFYEEWGR